MAIAQNNKILASDVRAVQTAVGNAYTKTKSSNYAWRNSITAGTLASYSQFTEIQTTINNANASYRQYLCNVHYKCSGHNSSYRGGNNSVCGNHSQDNSSFFNNKCGGEWKGWRGTRLRRVEGL